MAGAVLSGAIAAVDFDAAKAELRRAVEDFLTQLFAKAPDTDVARAAGYAVLGSGHRWRALVAVAAGKIFRDDSLRLVLPAACASSLPTGRLLCSTTCRAWMTLRSGVESPARITPFRPGRPT